MLPDLCLRYHTGLPVDHDGEELVLLTNVDFVNRNDFQITQSRLTGSLLQVHLVDTANHRFPDSKIASHIPNRHLLPQVHDNPSKALRVIAQFNHAGKYGVQHLLTDLAFQPWRSDEQHCPIYADPGCVHESIHLSVTNTLRFPH